MTKSPTVLLFIFLLVGCGSDAQVLRPGLRAYYQQHWSEAEVAFRAVLRDVEASAPRSPLAAKTLYYLASTLQKQGRPADAEPIFRRALDIFEAQSAGNDREVTRVYANALNDLAAIYALEAKESTVPSVIQEKCEQAAPLFRRALALREKTLGPDDPDVGNSLENLMFLYIDCKRWTEAEIAARRAVSFSERQRGPSDQRVVYLLDGLAGIYLFQGRLAEAEVSIERVLSSVEKAAGPTAVASKLDGYAGMLRSKGHEVEAKELEARGQAIRVKAQRQTGSNTLQGQEKNDAQASRVGAGVSAPSVVQRVQPWYTEEARAAHVQGVVILSAIVHKDGSIDILKVVRGLGYGLDEIAVVAMKQWKFRPGMKDGKPVDVALNIEVNFSLAK